MTSFRVLQVFLALCLSLPRIFAQKTIVFTGGNRGIGYAAIRSLQLSPSTANDRIVLLTRSLAAAKRTIANLPKPELIETYQVDLSDLASVQAFSKSWGKRTVDTLVLNAGVQLGPSAQPQYSAQGHELTIATNHIGPFLLLQRLLPNVKAAKAGRVVFTASGVHNPDEPGGNVGSRAGLGTLDGLRQGLRAPSAMINGQNTFDPDKAYKDSKLCNVLTCLELSRRLRGSRATSNCMNPGLVPTSGLFRYYNPVFVFLFTLLTRYIFRVAVDEETAGRRLAYLIGSPDVEGVNGQYFSGRPGASEFVPITPSAEAREERKAKELWELTSKLVKSYV